MYEVETAGKADEFVVRDELIEKRKNIKSFTGLVKFLKYVTENCNTGYGVAPRAIAQACLAVGYFLANKFGITGFQAGFVMWDFITGWHYTNNKCGLKITDYDDMLYPQYEYRFQKTISADTWKCLREQAKENLKNSTYAHPRVIKHWQSIVDGKVPFGYTVED